jgi:hypothetical protein
LATPLLADTVTALTGLHAGRVIVTGSHGGLVAAAYVARAQVRAAIFNDAGRGLDDAGIAGLAALAGIGIAACAVDHATACIGSADATYGSGIVGVCNPQATAVGVVAGMRCADAAGRLAHAAWQRGELHFPNAARIELLASDAGRAAVLGADSIGLLGTADAGAVLVIGSHCALHGGVPATALPIAARGAFFHDAGRGQGDAALSRLPVLAARGIPAAAVDCATARIGDARSMWETGIVSVVNAAAQARGIAPGTRVRDAAERLRQDVR